jgi:transketolase N-terminal domain/subunit
MATFTVRQGRRYQATLSLGLLERMASNEAIAERLRAAGFAEVSVSGSGAKRIAKALWPTSDVAEMPSQIADVVEI